MATAMLGFLAALAVCQSTLIPDERYQPRLGDDVRIYRREGGALLSAPAVTDPEAFPRWANAVKAGDAKGLDILRESGQLTELPPGTMVKVIEVSARGVTSIPIRGPGGTYIDASSQSPLFRYFGVRVLDGYQKDKVFYVDKLWVKRCAVVEPRVKPAKKRR